MVYDNCTYCEAPLIIWNERWNGKCKCPSCQNIIEVNIDFYSSDDPIDEEFGIITLKSLKRKDQEYFPEFQCQLDTEATRRLFFG